MRSTSFKRQAICVRNGKAATVMLMGFGLLVLGCCGIAGFFAAKSSKEQQEAIAEADKLYPSKPADAVAKYKEGYPSAGSRKAEIIQRIVDHEAEAGNNEEAKRWIERGLDEKLTINFKSGTARALLAKVEKDRAEQLAAKQVEKDKRVKERDTKNRKYTRDEFKQLVLGKTRDELIGLLGKPNATQESGDLELWDYYSRTTDPTTGKTDQDAQVEFQNGRVENVTFIRV
jgi:hypothetical protein